MKMNKIVLASLLSVSLLGASTSVFAAETPYTPVEAKATVDTTTTFNVTGGSLSLNVPTGSALTFGEKSMLQLMSGDNKAKSTTDFDATVNDTLGDGKGWNLNATYTGMIGTDKSDLGDTLTINGQNLTGDGQAATVFAASSSTVKDAMSNAKGDVNVHAAGYAIQLTVPADKAKVQGYKGTISWTASTSTNDVTTTDGVSVPAAQGATE